MSERYTVDKDINDLVIMSHTRFDLATYRLFLQEKRNRCMYYELRSTTAYFITIQYI